MKKRITSLLLALAVCLSLCGIPAMAADNPTVSGTYASGVVTVTGSGFVPTLRYSMIAVKDSDNNLVAIGGTTADGSGNLNVAITTGLLDPVEGCTVTVYHDIDGSVVATGDVTKSALTPAETPTTAAFEASTMTLSGVSSDMSYSVDGGANWIPITGQTVDLSAAVLTTAHGIQIRNNGDGVATGPSAPQIITLTQAAAPTGVGKTDETQAGANDGTLTGVKTTMEYRAGETAPWTAITGTSVTGLAPGTYQVRVKGAGTVLASEPVSLTIAAGSTSGGGSTGGGSTGGGSTGGGSTGGGGGGSAATTYQVSVPTQVNGGAVRVSPSNASKGSKVTLTVTPDAGYALDKLQVTDSNGDVVELTKVSDTQYTFIMPGTKVSVDVSFVQSSTEPTPDPGATSQFTDVSGHWASQAIDFVVAEGLFNGTSATTFSPDASMTRSMLATVLYRMAGEPAVSGGSSFSDVPAGQWYSAAVAWSATAGWSPATGTAASVSPTM